MESTGVYWIPLCDFLETQGFEVLIVDPRSLARNLKKKSDVQDAAWLQELHAFGMLKSCFRPEGEVRHLRTLWRHREHLITEAAKLLQMMQKVLVQMNVHLHLVVSNIAGATGMRILRAIAKGQRDPIKLAGLRDAQCKKSGAEIAKALEGIWDPAHLYELKDLLKTWDYYQDRIHACDREYEKAAGKMPDKTQGQPVPKAQKQTHISRNGVTEFDGDALIFKMTGVRLTDVDGLGANTVLTVLSETGPDLAAKFATEKHFAAWTTLAPRKHQSGKRTKFPARTASRVARAFRLAAYSLINAKTGDETAPPKQRHTAMQLYRRLRDEYHYSGSYDQVRRYVAKQRRDCRETFIPLAHDPGQRLECDFGHIYVEFPEGRRLVPVLVAAWGYSNYSYAQAMPTERTEAILAGAVAAFEFFGCVPRELWWDNPTTVVSQIFKGRERRPNERYAALASHYTFDPLFCMPARGNEKPRAETRVKVLQRQWATPVPHVADLDALNACVRAASRNSSAAWPAARSRSANASPATRPRRCRCRRMASMLA